MLTKDELTAKAKEIADDIADPEQGLTWAGVMKGVTVTMEVAEEVATTLPGMTGADKKGLALALLGALVNEVDLPGPDWIVKPIITTVAPFLIDQLVSAANGGYSFGKPASQNT